MACYFLDKNDLAAWVLNKKSPEEAAEILNQFATINGINEELSIIEACRSLFHKKDQASAEVLMRIISDKNEQGTQKQVVTAQTESRQRNGWEHGMRNKWNKVTHQYNDNTPWRLQVDKMYDKTHYATDEIKFDCDPNHVYSGEAIWRMYVMDKYSAEYQDENGKWVGGYINNRFHVFPTAGTPANPDVPRDGGNQLQLKPGERTRKDRPHTWSTERRLEEARGNKLEDLTVTTAGTKSFLKISSAVLNPERLDSKAYNVFKDSLDMKNAGFEYLERIEKISEHYKMPITHVAQIDAVATKLAAKHDGLVYSFQKKAFQATPARHNESFVASNDATGFDAQTKQPVTIPAGSTLVALNGEQGTTYHLTDTGQNVIIEDVSVLETLDNNPDGHLIQDAGEETGLIESPESLEDSTLQENSITPTDSEPKASIEPDSMDFEITDMTNNQ